MFSAPDKTSTSPVFDEKHIGESSPEVHATNPVVSSAEFVLEVSFHDVVRVKPISTNVDFHHQQTKIVKINDDAVKKATQYVSPGSDIA
jgi:hypothetical protein